MEWIVRTFQILGGDPASLDLAKYVRHGSSESVNKLKNQTNLTIALVALAASIIPVVHLGAVIVEIMYLIRRMAQMAWSVGILKGITVDREDLVPILAIWSGAARVEQIEMQEIITAKMSLKGGGKFLAKAPGKLAGKVASKLVLKLAAKTGGKLLVGFLSVLGGGVSAWISVYFLNTIVDAAEEYYSACAANRVGVS